MINENTLWIYDKQLIYTQIELNYRYRPGICWIYMESYQDELTESEPFELTIKDLNNETIITLTKVQIENKIIRPIAISPDDVEVLMIKTKAIGVIK